MSSIQQAEKHETYGGIAFLMLDQALGEYDVETKVGFIETKPFSTHSNLEKKPIKEVTKVFDDFWKFQEDNTNRITPTNAESLNRTNK